MEQLTIPAYSKKIGISRQAVWKSVTDDKRNRLPGVTKIELNIMPNGMKIYLLTYNPDSDET